MIIGLLYKLGQYPIIIIVADVMSIGQWITTEIVIIVIAKIVHFST